MMLAEGLNLIWMRFTAQNSGQYKFVSLLSCSSDPKSGAKTRDGGAVGDHDPSAVISAGDENKTEHKQPSSMTQKLSSNQCFGVMLQGVNMCIFFSK